MRISEDSSDLPQDFREVWDKYITDEFYIQTAICDEGYQKIAAQKVINSNKKSEWLAHENDFKLITESYGIKLNSNYRLE